MKLSLIDCCILAIAIVVCGTVIYGKSKKDKDEADVRFAIYVSLGIFSGAFSEMFVPIFFRMICASQAYFWSDIALALYVSLIAGFISLIALGLVWKQTDIGKAFDYHAGYCFAFIFSLMATLLIRAII